MELRNDESLSSNRSASSLYRSSLSYLPHLDGLRAIAVTAVLLFHFGHPVFPGGYSGVDIFLPLSGFLITSNILLSLKTNTFSLSLFYTRRFLRLYPAASLTTLLAVVCSYLTFPSDLALRSSLAALAAQCFGSNVYFHARDNYFDEDAVVKPLLHMWSLSLEEQFYMMWAPLLLLSWKLGDRRKEITLKRSTFFTARIMMSVIAIMSFVVAVVCAKRFPSFTFFELPPRAFQFASGGLLAVYKLAKADAGEINPGQQDTASLSPLIKNDNFIDESKLSETTNEKTTRKNSTEPKPPPSAPCSSSTDNATSSSQPLPSRFSIIGANVLSLAAIVTIMLSFRYLPPAAPPLLLLPTLLATLILLSSPYSPSHTTVITRLLSLLPLRIIGRLSYSAYLIHWPLYVFARRINASLSQSPPSIAVLLVATFFCAFVLHHAIEKPFQLQMRHTDKRQSLLKILSKFVPVILLAAAALGAAIFGVTTKGFTFRPTSKMKRSAFDSKWLSECNPWMTIGKASPLESAEDMRSMKTAGVQIGVSGIHKTMYAKGSNIKAKDSGVVLFGNSYVGMWRWGLAYIGRRRNIFFRIFQRNGCGLFPTKWEHVLPSHCQTANAHMWNIVRSLPVGSSVGVSSSWYAFNDNDTRLTDAVTELSKQLSDAGVRFSFIMSDTPGMEEAAQRYFACSDMAWMPIWTILRRIRMSKSKRKMNEDSWADVCVPGITDEGVAPFEGRLDRHRTIKSLAKKAGMGYVDLFKHLCGRTPRSVLDKDVRCSMPGNLTYGVYDIGYARDRHHLSVFGSFSLAAFLEDSLVKMGVLPPTKSAQIGR